MNSMCWKESMTNRWRHFCVNPRSLDYSIYLINYLEDVECCCCGDQCFQSLSSSGKHHLQLYGFDSRPSWYLWAFLITTLFHPMRCLILRKVSLIILLSFEFFWFQWRLLKKFNIYHICDIAIQRNLRQRTRYKDRQTSQV